MLYNVYFYRPVVDAMDFPKNYLDNLYSFPLNQVNQINNVDSPYDPPSQNVDQCDSTNIKQTENESRNDSQCESRSEICDTTQSESMGENSDKMQSKSMEQTDTKTESKDKSSREPGTSKQCNKTEGKHGKRKHRDKVNSTYCVSAKGHHTRHGRLNFRCG